MRYAAWLLGANGQGFSVYDSASLRTPLYPIILAGASLFLDFGPEVARWAHLAFALGTIVCELSSNFLEQLSRQLSRTWDKPLSSEDLRGQISLEKNGKKVSP